MKTPEEKAREEAETMISEYANNSHISREYYAEGYLSGYHSRDEEVKELREALKEIITMFEDLDGVLFHHNHSVVGWHLNGDHEPIMNFVADYVDYEEIEKAKQLLKE